MDPPAVRNTAGPSAVLRGCYRAANWTALGETTGRGRMDRAHQRHGAQVKTVMVYPLVKNARRRSTNGE